MSMTVSNETLLMGTEIWILHNFHMSQDSIHLLIFFQPCESVKTILSFQAAVY